VAGPIIELRGVTKRYGQLTALDALTLAVEPGSFTALLGGSGSGKTTALKTINGGIYQPDLLKTVKVGERVRFKLDSQQITELTPY